MHGKTSSGGHANDDATMTVDDALRSAGFQPSASDGAFTRYDVASHVQDNPTVDYASGTPLFGVGRATVSIDTIAVRHRGSSFVADPESVAELRDGDASPVQSLIDPRKQVMPHLLRHREPPSDDLMNNLEFLALRLWEQTKHLCEVRPVDGIFGRVDIVDIVDGEVDGEVGGDRARLGERRGAAFTEPCLREWASATVFGSEEKLEEALELMRKHVYGPFIRAVENAADATGPVCRYLKDSVTRDWYAVVRVGPGLEMGLLEVMLHLRDPGMCRRVVFPYGYATATTLVPGRFRVTTAATTAAVTGTTTTGTTGTTTATTTTTTRVHLYWTSPGPTGLTVLDGQVPPESETLSLFTRQHVFVLDNGMVLKPTQCSPLSMNAVGRFTAVFDGSQTTVSAGDVVFAARVGVSVRELQQLLRPPGKPDVYMSVDHLYKDISLTLATGTRIATQSEQCRHRHIRSEGTEGGHMVWHTLSELVAYLVAIKDPSALALCGTTSLSASHSEIQGRLVGLLEDDASFVQCVCAALPKGGGRDVVPIVLTKNLSLHLGLSCLRRPARQSGAFEYCMPEHTMATERSTYPQVRVTFEDASYKSRNVLTHTILLDTFAAHRPEAATETWERAADRGALAFDCVYTRSDDGTLQRRLRIQDAGTRNMENIEGDHRHDDRTAESREDNRLRARVDKLEWVTHSTNMRRASSLRLTVTMVFASCKDDGDDEDVEYVEVRSPEGMSAGDLHAWLAEQLELEHTQLQTWWKALLRSQWDSTVDLTRCGAEVARALSARRCLRLVISQEGKGEVVSLQLPGAEQQQQQQRVNLERRDGHPPPCRAGWWMLICVAEDRPMGVLLPGERACVRVINKVCPGLAPNRPSTFQWGMAHKTFQEHGFVVCPFSHDEARRAKQWKGDSKLLRQVVLAGDEAERGDALHRLRAHYDEYEILSACGKSRQKLKAAVVADTLEKKKYLKSEREHLKLYCLLRLDQTTDQELRHVGNCSTCFAHALVTLWEQRVKVAGSAAWGKDGLPTHPSLTNGYRTRKGALTTRKDVLEDGRVFVRLFQAVGELKKLLDGGDDERLEGFVRSVIREGHDDKENRQENLPAEEAAGVGGTNKRKRGLDWGEEDEDDEVDWDALFAIEASREVDWGEEDEDDEVDWEAVEAFVAEHLQGQMSGVAIDVDGMEGTLHD
jgi:hypothetical protein